MKSNQVAQELILDLYHCNFQTISSKQKIKEYVNQLCPLIGMKKYGPFRISRFAGDSPFGEGYSFLQFIETSSITGHFVELNKNIAYINIFSCKTFDVQKARQFSKKFFGAKKVKNRILMRELGG